MQEIHDSRSHNSSLELGALSFEPLQAPSSKHKAAMPGFTLIELMVVLALVVLISAVILVSSSRFNSSILLRSLAYQVGLSVREAQLYGVAVRSSPTPAPCFGGTTSAYCSSFGVHFASVSPTQYIVFADTNNNGVYDSESTVDRFTAQYGFKVSNFCGISGSTAACSVRLNPCPSVYTSCTQLAAPASLDIAFKRPSPNAIITTNGNVSNTYQSALIEVSSPGGSARTVTVSLTGQIVVTGTN